MKSKWTWKWNEWNEWNEHENEDEMNMNTKWNEMKRKEQLKKRKENDLKRMHELMNDWIKGVYWINWLN